ncbi:hypothetical protein SKAU_G00128810 [Synaphobranchus kaupii]|uniref:Uncharacterized protein n=1 Tax=Synaphobranchus kaupii TaxID=118154 RepID=A0A9Q1FQN1_SYNKA|nr:hypothetical protein SKAU_G00128810 [Synaphobranchus kaupii]
MATAHRLTFPLLFRGHRFSQSVRTFAAEQASGPAGGNMQLLETDFSHTLRELVALHLFHQNSIPAFLSAVTLDLFSRQTMA